MINCVHTGCSVLIQPHLLTVRADLYYIREAWIIRWIPTKDPSQWEQLPSYDYEALYGLWESSEVWLRQDIGVLVLPTELLVVHSDAAREKIKCFRTIVGVNLSVNKFGEAIKS